MDTVNNHATGPKTPEGKARSSQNARKSGWFAQDLRVAESRQLAYSEFASVWREELAPEGLAENELFADFLRAAWHKREIVAAQNELTESGPAAFLNDAVVRQLDRLHRYERDFERRAARHLAALRRLQSERAPAAAATPAGLSEEVARELYIMERDTRHINALLRACKAGIVPADTLRPAPRAA